MNFEQIAFIGESLGPLFLTDPEQGAGSPLFIALAQMDAHQAALEWPVFSDTPAFDVSAADDITKAVEKCLMNMKIGLNGDFQELIWEYRRLFAVSGSPKPAPPWGSYYTDPEAAICSETTLALRQWLAINGIGKTDDKKVEDHIGQMLLLMAWIARQRPEITGEFLQLHFLPWATHMLQALQKSTSHPFYNGLAQLCDICLTAIRDALRLEVIYPRFYR
ncbi:MAG: molecular chaperone TorD family protein [Coriobacteriales bacterium]|nr:molecular chaperone TorD family protein [Coriobacteriales bacterium]